MQSMLKWHLVKEYLESTAVDIPYEEIRTIEVHEPFKSAHLQFMERMRDRSQSMLCEMQTMLAEVQQMKR